MVCGFCARRLSIRLMSELGGGDEKSGPQTKNADASEIVIASTNAPRPQGNVGALGMIYTIALLRPRSWLRS